MHLFFNIALIKKKLLRESPKHESLIKEGKVGGGGEEPKKETRKAI